MIPIVSFVGKHNSGKTTVLSRVIDILSREGIKVAVIKHSASNLYIKPVTDSDKLFMAGAEIVHVSSSDIDIRYYRHEEEKKLSQIYQEVSQEVDIVITEGYKKESTPKIEVIRQDISTTPLNINNVIARVSDFQVDSQLPTFSFGQYEELALFLKKKFNISTEK